MKKDKKDSEANDKLTSKNQEKKEIKKIQKKLAKAIKSIVYHEKSEANVLFSSTLADKFIVYHHGNGDEEDYSLVQSILNENGISNIKLNVFPGISYGFLSINSSDKTNLEKFLLSCEVLKVLSSINVYNHSVKREYLKTNPSKPKSNEVKIDINEKGNSSNIDNEGKDLLDKDRPILFFPTNYSLEDIKLYKESLMQVALTKQTSDYNVPGLVIVDDIMTEEEEEEIVKELEKKEWVKLSHRQVQHYGYEFIYGKNNINKSNKIGELPSFVQTLNNRLSNILKKNFTLNKESSEKHNAEFYLFNNNKEANYSHLNINELKKTVINNHDDSFYKKHGEFDQLTINKYSSGDGIPPHVDSHSPFNDIYCSISLLSGVAMTFTKIENGKETVRNFYLKPRSAVFFTNELRYQWEHSISLRKVDLIDNIIKSRSKRISLTFRRIRKEDDCKCTFTEQCDSYKKSTTATTVFKVDNELLTSDVPTDIEKNLVYAVYERIAPHFSHTRYKPWPQVVDYLKSLEKYSLVGDVGCGNGKYLSAVPEIITLGTDRSFNLSKIAFEKNPSSNVFVADSLKLPLKSNCLDAAISIAVIHHFSNDILRTKAIKEIMRCVKPKGTFLIYVWALEQEDGKFKDQDNLVAWHLQDTYKDPQSKLTQKKEEEKLGNKEFSEENKKDAIESKGIECKEKRSVVYHRYYHVFKEKELENLLLNIEGIKILKSYYDHENWCCICEKQ